MVITSIRFIQFKKEDRIYAILISIGILIIGTILSRLNQFYPLLLFFIEPNVNNLEFKFYNIFFYY